MPKFFPKLDPEYAKNYSPKPYPFEIPADKIPPVQKHKYNGADFAYMIWPASTTASEASGNTTTTTSTTTTDITRSARDGSCRVIFVHGFGEYTKVYYRLMYDLSLHGIESCIFDQRGAGETSPYKLKGLTDSTHQFDDLDHFVDFFTAQKSNAESTSKDKPTKTYLFGHSMGGGIILNYGFLAEKMKNVHKIDGIVCTGPLIKLHPRTRPGFVLTKAMKLLATWAPTFQVDGDLDIDGITDDDAVKNWMLNDFPWMTPCVGSVRLMYDMLYDGERLVESTSTANNASNKFVTPATCAKFPSKVLILHGLKDTINDYKASQQFMEQVLPSVDPQNRISKKLVLLPHGRHSLAICTGNGVYDDLIRNILEFV